MANNFAAIKRGWHYNAVTGNLEAYNNGNEIFQYPFGTNYYVDDVNGVDTNSGLSWAKAFLTISTAMTAAAALGASTVRRGGVSIYAAPGGYTEDIITPLNTECPFGSLIGITPTRRSTGAAYITSSTTTEPALTVRARGWLIEGFEFDANTTDGCIFLDGTTSNSLARYTEIANCLFVGAQAGSTDFAVDTNATNPLCVIRDSMAILFASRVITSTNVDAQQWEIYNFNFDDCANYIAPRNSKGFSQGNIHDCTFNEKGGSYTATLKIDMRGGQYNMVGPNNFLSGTYNNSGGYYESGTDIWRGNVTQDHPSSTAQAEPAV